MKKARGLLCILCYLELSAPKWYFVPRFIKSLIYINFKIREPTKYRTLIGKTLPLYLKISKQPC